MLSLGLARSYLRYAPGTVGKTALADRLNQRLRDRPHIGPIVTLDRAVFEVDTTDIIQRYLYMFGVWEPHMAAWLRRTLRPGDCVVDVGANIGAFCLLSAKLVGPAGHVVAVEASPTFVKRLERNAELTGAQIRVVTAAVSDRHRKLTFALASSGNLGANSIVPYDGPTESTFSVDAAPLPELLGPDEIAAAKLIKIDVEGAEGQVVRGMESILDRMRHDVAITVEVSPDRMALLGDSVQDLLDIMARHGFHPYRIVNDYSASSYPQAVRTPVPPRRLRGSIDRETDLIFTRVDAEVL